MNGRKAVLAVAVALLLVFLLLTWRWFDLHMLLAQIRALFERPGLVFLMFAAYFCSFVLKALAWRIYEGSKERLGLYLHGIQYSLLVNHLLPIKLGDLVRAGVLMKAAGRKWDDALHSVAVMRLTDMLVLGAISVAGMLALGMEISWWTAAVAAVLAFVVIGAAKLIPNGKLSFLRKHGNRLKTVALSRRSPMILALVTASWVLEAAVLYGVTRASGITEGIASLVWANSVTIGGQLFHVTPGGIGTYESTLSGSLALLGVGWKEAYSAALLTHSFKFAVAFFLGGYSVLRMPIGWREAKEWIGRRPGRMTTMKRARRDHERTSL